MLSDIEKAKEALSAGENTCVLCKGATVYASNAKGVSPMLELLSSGTDLRGFSAADKVAGKAAAMLFALAGVREVYAEVLSEQAVPVFNRYGIRFSYGKKTEWIAGRGGTGICPMEEAVREIDDPAAAYDAIREKLKILRANDRNRLTN